MKDYYSKEDGHLVIRVPLLSDRYNPYEDGITGDMPTFTGLIIPQKNMGFAFTIDMDYKDKPDQWGDIEFNWVGDRESFIKKCSELGIDVVEYEKCANCKGPIYGCSTMSLELDAKYGGPVCSITCDN